MLQMLCEHPDWDATDMSSVRCVAYGGSPVLERVAKAWLARGIQVLQGYGMTEASPGVLMALGHGSLNRPVSAGVPHFFTDTALLTGRWPDHQRARAGRTAGPRAERVQPLLEPAGRIAGRLP